MNAREKESIVILSKFLTICKNDDKKFSIMRNYLHQKISKIFEKKLDVLSAKC